MTSSGTGLPRFRERLVVPLGGWLTGLALAGLTAVSIHSGAGGARAVVPYVVVPPLALLVLLALSRHRVEVRDGVLHVPGARAPLAAFGPVEVLDATSLREWRGVRAHRDAFVSVRPWLRTAVLLPVLQDTDEPDDTPYWLVGTRRPLDLAVAVTPLPPTL